MLAPLLCVLLLQAPLASDYFPLTQGRKLTYEERGASTATTIDTVVGELVLNGQTLSEIRTVQVGKAGPGLSAFYRVDADAVYLMGYSKDALLPEPMPLFKLSKGKSTWQYAGRADSSDTADGISLTGESEHKGKRKVLGRDVEVLEVRTKVLVGTDGAQEQIEQFATYAKGIGLVELVSKTRLGKAKLESTLKLTKIEEPGG